MMGEFYDCPQLRQGEYCEAVYAAMESMIGKNRSIQTVRSVHVEVCTILCGGVIRNKRGGMAEMWRDKSVTKLSSPLVAKVRPFTLIGRFTCVNCHETKEIEQEEPYHSTYEFRYREIIWNRLSPSGWFNNLCDKCNLASTEAAEQARKNALEQRANKRD